MNILNLLDEQMEDSNLNIALNSLRKIFKTKPKEDYIGYVRRLDFLTKTIHNHVWHNQSPRQDVKTEIIPLFNQAIFQIHGDEKYFIHTKETMRLRLKNLRGYLRGEESYAFLDFAGELAKNLAS